MKKILITILIMVMVNMSLFAIEYNTYKMEEVKQFPGNEVSFTVNPEDNFPDRLGLFTSEGYTGPNGPNIYFDGNKLVIADQLKSRTIYLDNVYNFDKILEKSFFEKTVYKLSSNILLGVGRSGSVSVVDISKGFNRIVEISAYKYELFRDNKDIFYHSNILFIHDENNKLWSISNPGLDDSVNRANLLDEEATLELFSSGDLDGLTIDSKKRLFLNGELQTIDFKVFYTYYAELHSDVDSIVKVPYVKIHANATYMNYLGRDSEGCFYWSRGTYRIVVFDKDGFLIHSFRFDENKSSTTPAVSPEGDIYFMHHAKDLVTLYKIKRQW